MDRLSAGILKHRRLVVAITLGIAALSTVMILGVKINFNMADYLPDSAQSTKALEIMERDFEESIPNASVMVRDVAVTEALSYKDQLLHIEGVEAVLWLDSVVDLKQPLETQDPKTVEGFYKNRNALFSITIAEGQEGSATSAIRELLGDKGAVSGEASDTGSMQTALNTEVTTAIAILLPLIILILVLSTTSWIEPLLFLAAIGVSVLINMGTNIIFGQVSFLTFSVAPILQLAVSLDYAIFLLHSFGDFRQTTDSSFEAMKLAMKRSVRTVAASATTTLFGFVALIFMEFSIGADLGFSLAKGIILSFMSCMVFLPALTLCCYKAIDKAAHRPLMPKFNNVWKLLSKIAIPATVLVAVLVVPSFMAQSNSQFSYQNVDKNPEGRTALDTKAIQDEFTQSTVMAILVPRGDIAKEYDLGKALEQVDHVVGVTSFANTVGTGIPAEFLDSSVTSQFYSEEYARIIVYTNTPAEGDVAFENVETLQNVIQSYYGDNFYTAGQSANLYDMRNVVENDNMKVSLIAIISIFLVLLLTFRSAMLPFILLFTIEAGIWINLAIPYFTGSSINFLGYLVINTVQLGATVDYAILLTSYYLENRQKMPQREAIQFSLGETFKSILVSVATLSIAGFTLALTSSNPAVSEIGLLLGRGTILSMAMVVFMLPILLTVFDKAIAKTTNKSRFFTDKTTALQEGKEVSQ